MKIKDCAVINIELLKHEVAVLRKNCEIFREFNDHQAVSSRMRVINTIESVIENSKPLTPIIQDALDEVSKGLCQTTNQWNSDFNGQKLYIKNFKYETEI